MRSDEARQRDRELTAARNRAYRARKKAAVVNIDDLAVTCHCEATILHVPRTVILAGRTASCGRPGCHAPTQSIESSDGARA